MLSKKHLFIRLTPKVSLVGVVLRAQTWFSEHLKFYRTSAGKSTFHTQNDTDKANFRCKADKNMFLRNHRENWYLFDESKAF